MKISKTFSARINPEILELLKDLAAKDNRTVNNYIAKIIYEHLEKQYPNYKAAKEEDYNEKSVS